MEVGSTLLSHQVLVSALKQINHPVNRMTVFGVKLEFLYQLMFECHIYWVSSSDFLLQRFLPFNTSNLMISLDSLCLTFPANQAHAENLTGANCCILDITDGGTITLDCQWCFIIITSWIVSLFLYLEAIKTSWFLATHILQVLLIGQLQTVCDWDIFSQHL